MASAVTLVDGTSCEPGLVVLTCPAIGARERVILVGISTALSDVLRFLHRLDGTNLRLPGRQMPVAAQHPYRLATAGAMKRLENTRKESLALPVLPGHPFIGVNAHRCYPAVCVCRAARCQRKRKTPVR